MSVVLRTIEAFPRGRTTEQLAALLGSSFDHTKKIKLLSELDALTREGKVCRGQDGKWRPTKSYGQIVTGKNSATKKTEVPQGTEALIAAPARFERNTDASANSIESTGNVKLNPHALLRYWRSALRADPRGATTAREDLHGVDWQLVCGSGPIAPQERENVSLSIALDALMPEFRKALLRREGEENALALGWPLAVGRRSGVPVIWPVGLLSATWRREGDYLKVRVEANDALVNPDWLNGAASTIGWKKAALSDVFAADNGAGLHSDDFIERLREAAAGHFRGRLTGENLLSQIESANEGIYNIAGLFLPGESTFTAGASRDLEALATWPEERLARSALAPVLGLQHDLEKTDIPVLNLGPLNAEQLQAVRHACEAPLSVVTGPPGTGKSQAIVSMAASALARGGTVLVSSKNHQALDAVEDRLGGIAKNLPFLVRTLDPRREIDRSFADVLAALVLAETRTTGSPMDQDQIQALMKLARERMEALDRLRMRADIECELGEILDQLDVLEAAQSEARLENVSREQDPVASQSRLSRLLQWLRQLLRIEETFGSEGLSISRNNNRLTSRHRLARRRDELRRKKAGLEQVSDPIELADRIEALAGIQIPALLRERVNLKDEDRRALAQGKDDLEFEGLKAPIPSDLVRNVLHRVPLWLASVLGTPKRIPLDDGLFDLVIFDESSQCDIASAIPLLARGKRAVVVGDDRQLSFIPQIGLAQDRNLMQTQGLPLQGMSRYAQSRRSLFDFALRVPDVPRVTLRHQYRSAGQIVDYISSSFYGGELVVAQPPGSARMPKGIKPGLDWTDIKAAAIPDNGNVNYAECDAIVSEIVKLLLEQKFDGTIGVISPFRTQVIAIEEALAARQIPEDRSKKAELRVSTVDGFQGQERDVIFFTPCVSFTTPATATTFLQRDHRRLNVAISRAKAVVRIFGDLAFARSGKVRALARLAARATEPRERVGEGVFDSEWERRVYHALKERGLDPKPQHEIAGRRLDFALFGKGEIKLDLEVDGRRWHQTADGRRKSDDLWRDQQMKALGWKVRRFWVDELSANMETCLDLVEQDLC